MRESACLATTIRAASFGLALVLATCGAGCRGHEPGAAGGGLEAAIADVEAGRRTTPLVGEPGADGRLRVTFLAKAVDGRSPRIVSDVTGWGEDANGSFDFGVGGMRQVGKTAWFSLETRVAARARIEYLLAYSQTDYRRDPHNPRGRPPGNALGGPPASEFVTPGYVAPAEFAEPSTLPSGTVETHRFDSRALARPCTLTVYTPPGYTRDRSYPLALFVDSGQRLMPRVMDWAIAHGDMEPIVAVFALPDIEGRDQPSRDEMRAFAVEEVPRWLAGRYAVADDPARRAVLGISFGARDALHIAVSSPRAYGLLGLLIPGRRIGREDIEAIGRPRAHRVRAAILAGEYDRANVPTARAVREALTAAGDGVEYFEVPEGHSPATFHNNMRAVLGALFGKK